MMKAGWYVETPNVDPHTDEGCLGTHPPSEEVAPDQA